MGFLNDLQNKKGYSKQEKNTFKKPTLNKNTTKIQK